ncbi:hypothetical protein KC887_00180 [Candidatus Kaiserbacteria bacterium]|nr:hypothetical protein [Candidatus Kaiserbacteria bacterium]
MSAAIEQVRGDSIKLGDQLFAVTNQGEIIPTLVSEIALVDKEVRPETIDWRLRVRVKGLLSYPYPLYRTMLSARAAAVSMLGKRLKDDSLTVREHAFAQGLYDQYTALQSDAVLLQQLQPTNHYRVGKDEWCTPADFPCDYYKPGTGVFVVDLKHWRLIDGFVTKVHFNPSYKSVPFGYCCGDMPHVLHEQLYTDKHTALRYMSAKFAETLPGMLDCDRVSVVAQTSQKAATEKMAARTHAAMRDKLL